MLDQYVVDYYKLTGIAITTPLTTLYNRASRNGLISSCENICIPYIECTNINYVLEIISMLKDKTILSAFSVDTKGNLLWHTTMGKNKPLMELYSNLISLEWKFILNKVEVNHVS